MTKISLKPKNWSKLGVFNEWIWDGHNWVGYIKPIYPLKWKWQKYSKIFKNYQNTLKPTKWQKYSRNPKNDQNTPQNPRNDQNTPKT